MTRVEIQVPEGVLAALRVAPDEFSRELRLAAAVKWYEQGTVSQARAAEISGLSRAEFIQALGRFNVSPFQDRADELTDDALNG